MDFVVSVQEYKSKTTSSLDEQPIEWKISTAASYSEVPLALEEHNFSITHRMKNFV